MAVVGSALSNPLAEARSLLVPTDGSDASLEAVELACSVLKKSRGRLTVVHVIEVPRSLPLDADLEEAASQGEQFLVAAEAIAKQNEVSIEGELLQARETGHAVVDEAAARDVDGIILGIEHHTPFGEYRLGMTTDYVLRNARCPVIVYRQRLPEKIE